MGVHIFKASQPRSARSTFRSYFSGEVCQTSLKVYVDVTPRSCEKLQFLRQNYGTNLSLQSQSVLVNHSSKAYYTLEGDGLLALSCYEVLSAAKASIQVKHWTNTHTLAQKFIAECQIPALEQQLMTYALSCVKPRFICLESKFRVENCCLALNSFKQPVSLPL